MKEPKIGEGWRFRDKVPENNNEIIQLFESEVKEFRNWIKTVSFTRKESRFWECDYEEQLYLDVSVQLIFENFGTIEKIPKRIIEELIFIIARNREQGNILAWKKSDEKISYLGMDETQFRFIAKEIVNSSESEAKFQVANVFRKLKRITENDKEVIRKMILDSNEYVRKQSLITLNKIESKT